MASPPHRGSWKVKPVAESSRITTFVSGAPLCASISARTEFQLPDCLVSSFSTSMTISFARGLANTPVVFGLGGSQVGGIESRQVCALSMVTVFQPGGVAATLAFLDRESWTKGHEES